MITEGTLLDGRIRYRQLATGHRTGIEPVLLAAAVPAEPGDHVLEGGTGAGAGLLCLLHRAPLVRATGFEASATLAALTADNLVLNGFEGRSAVLHATLPDIPLATGTIGHAFANPPWFEPTGTAPRDGARRLARTLPDGAEKEWSGAFARLVRPGGTLALIVPASSHARWGEAMRRAGFGAVSLVPLWPRAGREARLVILRGCRGARGPDRIRTGLVLHEAATGRFTIDAERILREGQPFPGL